MEKHVLTFISEVPAVGNDRNTRVLVIDAKDLPDYEAEFVATGDLQGVSEGQEPKVDTTVEALLRIVDYAVAVLDSEAGGWSLAELSVAVRDAGFGDFTDSFDVEALAGESNG